MIKARAHREKPKTSAPGYQDYVEKQPRRDHNVALGFLLFLTACAAFIKSCLPFSFGQSKAEDRPAERAAKEEVAADAPPSEADQPTAVAEEETGASADKQSDNVVAYTRFKLPPDDDVGGLLMAEPPLDFRDLKRTPLSSISAGMPGNVGRAVNDNRAPGNEGNGLIGIGSGASGGGGGGGGGGGSDTRETRTTDPHTGPRNPTGPNDPPSTPGNPDQHRNRAPRVESSIQLRDLMGCQLYFIPILSLLAGASDADGDTLSVVNVHASSGTLTQVDGGWQFIPDIGWLGEVSLTYSISDGVDSVQQLAQFRVVAAPPIIGSEQDDNLLGTECGDVIDGKDGDDNIDARGGNDVIAGGAGNDHIMGGAGNDVIYAGAGDDIVFAGAGNDIVYGGSGNDRLFGEAGNDTLLGEEGDDLLSGGDGDDLLRGGTGHDTLLGDAGNDALDGEEGDDRLEGGEGNDVEVGGTGADLLLGGAGSDILVGGDGNDILDGGIGNDTLDGGEGNDALQGGAGEDRLVGAAGDDSLEGGTEDDVIDGGDGNDTLDGGAGNDILIDGKGEDVVSGGEGNDTAIAAADMADDQYAGASGEDTLDYSATTQGIAIVIGEGTAEGDEIGKDHFSGFEIVIAGKGDDWLKSGPGDAFDLLISSGGSIRLTGGDGDDVFEFEAPDPQYRNTLVQTITDFSVGDRLLVAEFNFRKNSGPGSSNSGPGNSEANDPFQEQYFSDGSGNRSVRIRFENRNDESFTVLTVSDGIPDDDFYIKLLGYNPLCTQDNI